MFNRSLRQLYTVEGLLKDLECDRGFEAVVDLFEDLEEDGSKEDMLCVLSVSLASIIGSLKTLRNKKEEKEETDE